MAVPGEPRLSVVIPAYNEQTRILLTLARTVDFLRNHQAGSEVIVVDDGSTDQTAAMVGELCARAPEVRLIRLPRNQGKGAAVRRGVLEAAGDRVLFMDADLATPIEELLKLLFHARRGHEIVIGSRGLAGQSEVRRRQPALREAMGRAFNLLVSALLLDGIRDTQCGFKLFSRGAARALFSRQTVDGFAFDVEVLLLARELGYRICEVPVVWYHAPQSKVSPLTDAGAMLRDVIRLRRVHARAARP